MPNIFKLKRRVSGGAGAPSTLASGELAYNMSDGKIYVGFGDDGGGNATSVKTISQDNFISNIPTGGTTGQALVKNSNTAGDVTWGNVASYTAGSGLTLNAGSFAIDSSLVALLASPALTGTPTAPTATGGTNTTQIATTAFVTSAVSTKLDSSTASSTYAPLASPTFTGTPLLTTSPNQGDNSTKIASTAYVDIAVSNAKQSMYWKPTVRAVALSNITLSGTQTIDTVSIVAGDRVLAIGQTAPAQNGIWIAAAGAWTRATDMDVWSEVAGATVMVEAGTYEGHGFTCTNDLNQVGTLGTTAITFIEFTGATNLIAGNGISKSGNTVSAVVTGSGITLGAGGIALSGTALSLAGITGAADQGVYFTSANTLTTYSLTSFGRSLVGAANATAANTTLGLGSMALQAASSVAITGGTINGITLDGGTF